MSDDLINYIIQQINSGHKIDQVETYLKSYGYDSKDVDISIKTAIDMSARSYIDYIDNLVNTGYTLAQIRSSMTSQGYDYRIVDYALNHYHKNFFSAIKDKLIPNSGSSERKKLENEIKKETEKGISYGLTLENIQSNLVLQGYDFHLVNKIINTYRQSHFHIPKQAVFIFLALAIVGSFSFIFIGNGSSFSSENGLDLQERLLDLTSENSFPNRDLEPGDDLHYIIKADQMGFQREFDIDFVYEIRDLSGNVLRRTRDTKAVVSNLGGKIPIPSSISPGKYEFKVFADYKGEVEARSSFEFYVVSPDGTIPDVDDIPIPETDDFDDYEAEDEEPDFIIDEDDFLEEPDIEEIEDVPDINDPNFNEEDFDIRDLTDNSLLLLSEKSRLRSLVSRGESSYADYLCSRIRHDAKSDQCHALVALESSNIEYCESISTIPRKELCYYRLNDDSIDPSVCETITTKQLNTLCRITVIKNKNLQLSGIEDQLQYQQKIAQLYG